jgi:hypothetical protein
MPTLGEIRTALADTIKTAIDATSKKRLSVYPTVPGKPNLPCIVPMPADTDFNGAMGRGLTNHTIKLYVLTSLRDFGLGQNELDEFVADRGERSIREIIWNKRDLGLVDDQGQPLVNAHVDRMEQYGGQHDAAGVEHIAAILIVQVHASGRG